MANQRRRALTTWIGPLLGLVVSGAAILIPGVALAQGLTGALIGTVKDADGGVLPGATVRVSSPALIGGPRTLTTNENGQLRFPTLPPGLYVLDIELAGFASSHEADIPIGAGATIERTVPLRVAGVVDSVVVEGTGSRIDARNSGFGTRVGPEDLTAIPVRRLSVYDWVKTAPGISPTSPAGASMLVSAFGSGVDQNQFFIDGMNVSAPTNGVGRSDPSVDFVQELQIQSVGVSAEYGNVQGAVVNIITRSGSNRFLYDASYYAQTAGLTSQPVLREYDRVNHAQSGFERDEVPRLHDHPWRAGGARSAVVLLRIPVPARLRQSARHRPDLPQDVRAGQDPREAHLATGSGLAAGAEFSRGVLVQPRGPDLQQTDRRDPVRQRIGARDELRPSDARALRQYRVGRAGRTLLVFVGDVPALGRSDDPEPRRPAREPSGARRRKPSAR